MDQLQRLQRASTEDDVITHDVTSASQVADDRSLAGAGGDGNQL